MFSPISPDLCNNVTMMQCFIYSHKDLIGEADFVAFDPGMGVISAPFRPSENYEEIRPTIREFSFLGTSADTDATEETRANAAEVLCRCASLELTARTVSGERLELAGGVSLLDYSEELEDLAVEIISPESALRDRGTKYAEYEAGGVREYWIIDADARRADFFVQDAEGRYQRAREDAAGKYESAALPGFWIDLNWLWQTPLPTVRQVLRAWEEAA